MFIHRIHSHMHRFVLGHEKKTIENPQHGLLLHSDCTQTDRATRTSAVSFIHERWLHNLLTSTKGSQKQVIYFESTPQDCTGERFKRARSALLQTSNSIVNGSCPGNEIRLRQIDRDIWDLKIKVCVFRDCTEITVVKKGTKPNEGKGRRHDITEIKKLWFSVDFSWKTTTALWLHTHVMSTPHFDFFTTNNFCAAPKFYSVNLIDKQNTSSLYSTTHYWLHNNICNSQELGLRSYKRMKETNENASPIEPLRKKNASPRLIK